MVLTDPVAPGTKTVTIPFFKPLLLTMLDTLAVIFTRSTSSYVRDGRVGPEALYVFRFRVDRIDGTLVVVVEKILHHDMTYAQGIVRGTDDSHRFRFKQCVKHFYLLFLTTHTEPLRKHLLVEGEGAQRSLAPVFCRTSLQRRGYGPPLLRS